MKAPATFRGWQDDGEGGKIALFDLTGAVGCHPAGSTVSEQTLAAHGFQVFSTEGMK